MTVNCLTDIQKSTIVSIYESKIYNQKELAQQYHTSARTINRILIEAGVATPVERIKGDAYQVMQLLKKHGVGIEELTRMLEPYTNALVKTKEADAPWYPDDSGEWVEVPDTQMEPPTLPSDTQIFALLKGERIDYACNIYPYAICDYDWCYPPETAERIVAYKVVN